MKILFVVYDNDSYIHAFPLGTAYNVSVLLNAGHSVDVYNQDVHHFPDEHLTRYLDKIKYDMIGVGFIGGYYQYKKVLSISQAINNSINRPAYFVLGGHGPSPEPEYFLKKTSSDIVVIGEGEQTLLELCAALDNREPISDISGIAYMDNGNFKRNSRRGLISDIDSIPMPAYHLFPMEYYRLMRLPHADCNDFVCQILSARGCIFKCNFCYRMDEGYRVRSPEGILEEIEYLQKQYEINYIDFTDDLLMASRSRVTELCEAFLQSPLKFKWFCNGRLNFAKSDTLKLMKKSGCVFINYGIESFDDAALKAMNKAFTTSQIIKGVEATLNAGISPGLNIIFGNIGENAHTLEKGVDFLLKYDDGSQFRTIRPVTPYPGSPLYYKAIESGLLKDVADFYENRHINSDRLAVNFTNLSDKEFYKCLLQANTRLIKKFYGNKLSNAIQILENLYNNPHTQFRGFRQT